MLKKYDLYKKEMFLLNVQIRKHIKFCVSWHALFCTFILIFDIDQFIDLELFWHVTILEFNYKIYILTCAIVCCNFEHKYKSVN